MIKEVKKDRITYGDLPNKYEAGTMATAQVIAFDQSIKPNKSVYLYWHDLKQEKQIFEAPSDLILPHPRMHERAFVLIPLLDIAPSWVHPVLMKNTSQLCDNLNCEDISHLRCI